MKKKLWLVLPLLLVCVFAFSACNLIEEQAKKEHTVTFRSESGALIQKCNVSHGTPVEKPSDPEMTDHTFIGWYTNLEEEAAYDFSTPIENDMTLIAKWKDNGTFSIDACEYYDSYTDTGYQETATITGKATKACKLLVRYVDEDLYFSEDTQNRTPIENDTSCKRIDVENSEYGYFEISSDLSGAPEHFVLEVVLVDETGKALCSPATNIKKTTHYSRFINTYPSDYADHTVLTFLDDGTAHVYTGDYDSVPLQGNNWAVLAKDVVLRNAESIEVIFDENGEESCYQIQALSDTVNPGERIYVTAPNHSTGVLCQVQNVNTNGNITTVTPTVTENEMTNQQITDYYVYLRAELMQSFTYTTENQAVSRSVDVGYEGEVGKILLPLTFESEDLTINGTVEGTAAAEIVFTYAPDIFGERFFQCDIVLEDRLEASVGVSCSKGTDASGLDKKRGETTIELGELHIPLQVPTASAFVDLDFYFQWEISGSLQATYTNVSKVGFRYNTIDGLRGIREVSANGTVVDCSVDGTLRLGPNPKIGAAFLKKVVKAEISAFAGIEFNCEATGTLFESKDAPESLHRCKLCIDGELCTAFRVNVSLTVELTKKWKWVPFSETILEGSKGLFDFYASVISDEDFEKLGTGDCPNVGHEVTIRVYADANYPISIRLGVQDVSTKQMVRVVDLLDKTTKLDSSGNPYKECAVMLDVGEYSANVFYADAIDRPVGKKVIWFENEGFGNHYFSVTLDADSETLKAIIGTEDGDETVTVQPEPITKIRKVSRLEHGYFPCFAHYSYPKALKPDFYGYSVVETNPSHNWLTQIYHKGDFSVKAVSVTEIETTAEYVQEIVDVSSRYLQFGDTHEELCPTCEENQQ